MRFNLLVFCAVLCAQAFAGPVGQYTGQCAKFCTSNNKFNYEIGQTYEYDYELENLIGTKDGEESRLHLKATVLVTPQTSCDFTMQLRNVVVEGDYGTLASDLERFPLAFAFQDGRIEELCPSADENSEVLNIKRGILSSMQNSMEALDSDHVIDEIDVTGNCEAEYKIHTAFWGGSVTVVKTKDLNACKDRSSHMAGLHSIGYHADSDYQEIPLMKSQHKCEQTIQEHRLHSSKCEETHSLRPFSGQDSGASSRSTQTLNFVQKTTGQFVPNVEMGEKTNLLFDHMATSDDDEVVKKNAMQLLRELTQESQEQVTPALASKFSHLVSTLRKLTFSNLNGVYRNAAKDERMKKFFMDALPVIGSGPGISMMKEVILRGEVTESQADVWYTSLAFTSRPTTDMLEASLELLETPAPKQAMLGVSAMIHRFCSLHQNCVEKREVKALLTRLEAQLGSSCRTTSQDEEDKIMVVLKSIGNAGQMVNENILSQCFQDEANSVRVRVAALEAFRRLPCGSYNHEDILRTFRDVNKDAELRIEAYLTVMRCPSHEIVSEVKEALSSEPINQVGSFVWTHLTNLQETSDPSKQEAKELLASDFLRNKFNTNGLKFSRNYEMSLFSEKWNVGSQLESNVIFSKSPVPRSMNYNFTINLFGESFNLFEVGGRVEGVESFLEKFFGPNGYFPEERVAGFLSAMKGQKSEGDDVDRLSTLEVDPRIDGFLRVFGNELAFGSLKNEEDIKNLFGGDGPCLGSMIRELMLKDEIDFTKSSHFMNAQFTVPTSSGLPLSLSVNGTALLRLQAKKNLASSRQGFELSGHFKPSAAVQVTTLMSVEAGKVRSGVQVESTLHTSTILDGGFTYKDGQIFNVHVNMPRERQEIVSLDSRVFVVNSQEKKELSGDAQSKIESQVCTGDITSKPLGIQLCGEFSLDHGFPTNGPAHAAVYLEKTDDFSQYLLEMRQDMQTVNPRLELTIDTPNSRVNRKHEVSLSINGEAGNLQGVLETPFMSFGLDGNYKYEPMKKEFNVVGTANQEEAFSVHGSVNTVQNTRRVNLRTTKPELTVSVYGVDMLSLKGSLDSSDTGKAMQVNVESAFLPEPITFKSNMNEMDNQIAVNAEVRTPVFNGETTGYVATNKASISGNYQVTGEPQESFEVAGKYTLSGGRDKNYSGTLGLKSSQVSSLNTDIELSGQVTPTSVDTRFKMEGPLNFEVAGKMAVPSPMDIQMNLSAKCLRTQAEYSLLFAHQGSEERSTTKLSTHTSNNYDLSIISNLIHKRSPMNYAADLNIRVPNYHTQLVYKIAQASEHEIVGDLMTDFNGQYLYKASGKLSNLPQNKHVSLTVELPQYQPLKVEARATMEGHKVTGSATVEYEGQQYLTEMEFVGAATRHDQNELAATLKYPTGQHTLRLVYALTATDAHFTFDLASSRHISARAIISPHSSTVCDFDIFWDKSNDSTKSASLKIQNHSPTYTVEASLFGRTVLAETTSRDGYFNAKAEWGSGKVINLLVETNPTSMECTLTTPFQGFERQSFTITTDVQKDAFDGKFEATWKTHERFGLKVNGRRETGSGESKYNGIVSVESSTNEFLNGLSASIDHSMSPVEERTLSKVIFKGQTYESSRVVTVRTSGGSTEIERRFEVRTPESTVTMNSLVEYDNENFHLKVSTNIPNIYENELELTGKYKSTSGRFTLVGDASYRCSYVKPTNLKFNVQRNGPKVNLEGTLVHDQNTLADFNVKGALVSSNSMNGKVSFNALGNNFDGSFEHSVSSGPTSVLTTKVDGELNGKKLTAFIDGRSISGQASSDFVLDASLMSPWEAYNDWRISFQHTTKNNRYQTTMNVSKGTESASFDQDLSVYTLPNFQHKLNVRTPYTVAKSVNLETEHKWGNGGFSHNTKGSWNEKNIATSAEFNLKSSRKTRHINGNLNIETPFTNNIRASLKHEDDGDRYNPSLNLNYGNQNLITVEATGYMNPTNGDSTLKVTLPKYNPVMLTLVYDIKPQSLRTTFTTEYGQGSKVELHKEVAYEGDMRTARFYLDNNGQRTEGRTKFSLTSNKVVGEYYMSSPSMEELNVKGVMESEFYKQKLHLKASYGSRNYELEADANMLRAGNLQIQLRLPNTKMSAAAEYNLENPEKTINGYLQVDESRMEFDTALMATAKEGKFTFDLTTPVEGFRKVTVDSTYVNGHKNKKVKFVAHKDDQEVKLKGKLNLGATGELYIQAATPFNGYKTVVVKGTYDTTSEEKQAYLSGEWEDLRGEVTLKGKFTATEMYVLSDIRSSVTEKQSLNLHLKTGRQSLSFVGDWNGQKVEIDGSYDRKSFEMTAKYANQEVHFRGHYDAATAKLELQSSTETMTASATYGEQNANVVLRRNNDEIRVEVAKTPSEVSLDVYTPFPEYETLKFSARYSLSNAHKTATISFSKNRETIMRGDAQLESLGPKQMKISALLSLPSTSTEMSTVAEYNLSDKQAKVELSYNGQKIMSEVTCRNGDKTCEATLVFVSPFKGYENLRYTVEVGHGHGSSYAKFTSNVNGDTSTSGIELTNSHNNFVLRAYAPSLGLDDVVLAAEYEFTDTEKSGKVSYGFNGEHQELSFGSKYDDDTLESNFNYSAADYRRSIAGRVKRSLEFIYSDSVTRATKSEVIEVSGSLGLTANSGKAHVQVKTPFNNWEYFEGLINYNLQNEVKSFDVEINNGEKRYRMSGEGRMINNMIEVTLQTPVHGYERLEATLEYDLKSQNKHVRLAGNADGRRVSVSVNGHFTVNKSDATVEVVLPSYNKKVTASYDLTRQTKEAAVKVESELNSVFEYTVEASVGMSGHFNTHLFYSPRYTASSNLEYDFTRSTKTVKLSLTREGKEHSIEGSLMLQRDEIGFELNTSFEPLKYVNGKATYNFTPNRKNVEASVEWENKKFEVNGNLETQTSSTDLSLLITSPIPSYESINLRGKVESGVRPSFDVSFRMPSKTFEGKASYYITKTNGELSLEVTSPVQILGEVRIDATYDLRSNEKQAELVFTKNGEVQRGNVKVSYEGTMMNGTAYVKLDTPYFANVDAEVRTNISPDMNNSEVEARFGEKTLNVQFNMKMQGGYIKTNSNTFPVNAAMNWDLYYSKFEANAKATFELNQEKYVDVNITANFRGLKDVNVSMNLNTRHVPLQRVQIEWNFNRVTKFDTTFRVTCHQLSYEYNMKADLRAERGELKLLSTGDNVDRYDFEAEYTVANDKIIVNLKTPFTKPMQLEGYYTVENDRYNLGFKTEMGQWSMQGHSRVVPGKEFEVKLNLPMEGFEKLAALVKVDCQTTRHGVFIELEKGFSKITLDQTLTSEEKKLAYSASLSTPFISLESASVSMSLAMNEDKYEGEFSCEYGATRISGEMALRSYGTKETTFNASLNTPFSGVRTVSLDTTFSYDENSKKPEFTFKLEKENQFINMNAHAHASYPEYGAKLSLQTPVETLKDLSIETLYKVEPQHKISMSYRQNDNIRAEATGTLFASYSEGEAKLDIKTSVETFKNLFFQSSYNFKGVQKHVSAKLDLLNNLPIEFESTWNYGAPTVLTAHLSTPWNQPNFSVTIESDLQSANKNAFIKFESNNNEYEMRYSRNVSGHESFDSITVRTPLEGYESANLKWSVGPKSFKASTEYSGKTIEFATQCSTDNDVYSMTASLKTPFAFYENTSFRFYYKKQNGHVANGAFSWGYDKKIEGEMELNESKVFVKFDSPYAPFKNVVLDAKVEQLNGYRFVGILEWQNNRNEVIVQLNGTSISIDVDSPFEPFTDMHLKGELRQDSNEYSVNGFGKWNSKQVQVRGSWLKYNDFGIKTRLEVETPVAGYENSAIELDIKKPMNQEGVDAKLEINITGYPRQNLAFLLKHNGPTDVDVSFAVGNIKPSVSYKINRNPSMGETEITVSGSSLPLENLNKFSFYGKTSLPNNSNMKVNMELQTPQYMNRIDGHYKIAEKDIDTSLSVDLPSLVHGPVSVTFNIRKESFTNFNMNGALVLPHKTYEAHGSFLMGPTSLKMLFKENGLYDIEAEIDTTFKDGITVDATYLTPRGTHNLNGSFHKTGTGMEIRSELQTPLLAHNIGFKITANYLENSMSFVTSIKAEKTYTLKADYTTSGDQYTGEVVMEESGGPKAKLNVDYHPYSGTVRVELPSGTHEVSFSLKTGSKKVTFNISATSPLLSGIYEATCSLKSDSTSHKFSVRATTGATSHVFNGLIASNDEEKKVEAKLETPLLPVRKIKLTSALRNFADKTEGEVSLNLPSQVHSVRATLEKGMNAEIRVTTPWLSSNEIHLKTVFQNTDNKKVIADISYKNGEQKVQLNTNYDITDPAYNQAEISLRTNYAGLEHSQLRGHLSMSEKPEFELKLEGGEAYLPNFSISGSYQDSSSAVIVEFNAKTNLRDNVGYGLLLSLSPDNVEGHRLRLSAPGVTYEVSATYTFRRDQWSAEGTIGWDNKHITGSVEATYENPMRLRVNIQTPFQGYEHLTYHGKIFWNFEQEQSTKRYTVGAEWNEKKFEVKTALSETMITAEIHTPFDRFNKYEIALHYNPTQSGHNVRVMLVCPYHRWEATAEYNLDALNNANFKVEVNAPFRKYNFSINGSSYIKDRSFDARLVATSYFASVNVHAKGALANNGMSFTLENNGQSVLKLNGKMVPKEKLEADFYLRLPHERREHSGSFTAMMKQEGEQMNYGFKVVYNNKEMFEIRLVSQNRKVSVKVTNPFYPVSLSYTYDNTPTNFEIEGELCWNLNKPVESTLGGNLFLQNGNTGSQLKVKVSAPNHHIKVHTVYEFTSSVIDHQLTIEGNMPNWHSTVGYELNIEKTHNEYVGMIKSHIPNYPMELSGRYTTAQNSVSGKITMTCPHTESFATFHLSNESNSAYKGQFTVGAFPLLPYQVDMNVEVQVGPNYSATLDVTGINATPLHFKANLSGDMNNTVMDKRAEVTVHMGNYKFEATGSAGYNQQRMYGNVEYDVYTPYRSVRDEYFAELQKEERKFRLGKTNDFLLEGRLQPSESGYQGSMTTQIGDEEYNANISIHNDPTYVKMDAKNRSGSLLNARFDATDVLSTKIYIQPGLIFNLQDVFSDFM